MRKYSQQGFTLVELLIGLVIALILLGGATYVFIGSSESSIYQLRSTRFVQQMRDVMDRMVADIRRSGYQGYQQYVNVSTLSIDNIFAMDAIGGIKTDVNISKDTGEADDSCITYSYNLDEDYDGDGANGLSIGASTISGSNFDSNNMELFGFKLDDGEVKMRTGMGGATTFDCSSGTWQSVTDPDVVNITKMQFSLRNTECMNITDSSRNDCEHAFTGTDDGAKPNPVADDILLVVREVKVVLEGQAPDYSDTVVSMSQTIDLPNPKAYLVPGP